MQLLPMLTFLIHLTISYRYDASYALSLHRVFLKYKELFYIATAQLSKSGKSNPWTPFKLASSSHTPYKSGSNPGKCEIQRSWLLSLLPPETASWLFLIFFDIFEKQKRIILLVQVYMIFLEDLCIFGKNADPFHCMRKHEVLIGPIIRNIDFYHFVKMESATFLNYKVNYYICCTIQFQVLYQLVILMYFS